LNIAPVPLLLAMARHQSQVRLRNLGLLASEHQRENRLVSTLGRIFQGNPYLSRFKLDPSQPAEHAAGIGLDSPGNAVLMRGV